MRIRFTPGARQRNTRKIGGKCNTFPYPATHLSWPKLAKNFRTLAKPCRSWPKLAKTGQSLPKCCQRLAKPCRSWPLVANPCRSWPLLAEAAVYALPRPERGCYTIEAGRLSGDHGKATSREVHVMGTKWSTRRVQVLQNWPRIVELLRKGETLPSIHRQLTESGDIDMALRTFRLYASDIRDRVRRKLEE